MARKRQIQSLFNQKLDRAVFAIYFLGAIVPLGALGLVVHRFVPADAGAALPVAGGLAGAFVGIGCLSLAAFFALRRLTRDALSRMDRDNARLKLLLSASREFASAPHVNAVAEVASRCAAQMLGVPAAGVLLSTGKHMIANAEGRPSAESYEWEPGENAGRAASDRLERNRELIEELAAHTVEDGRAAISAEADGGSASAMVLGISRGKHDHAALWCASEGQRSFEREEQDAAQSLAAMASAALKTAELRDAQRNFFAHMTEILTSALDAHVDNRAGHAKNVARLSNLLARELGFADAQLEELHFAALLHDIGMLRVDRDLHHNPAGFQKHVVFGQRMLSRIKLWERLAPIVLHHHERFDGSGYPQQLAGAEIPIESRILAVADAVDAMGRPDPGQAHRGVGEIVAELERGSGGQFDPDVVTAFRGLVERGDLDTLIP